jgi:hypothetical protein
MLLSKAGEVKRKVPSFQPLEKERTDGASSCGEPGTARVSRALDHLICLSSPKRNVPGGVPFLCPVKASPFDRQIDLTSSGHGGMNARTPSEAPLISERA